MSAKALPRKSVGSVLVLALLGMGQLAYAGPIPFITPVNSKTSDGSVNGEADITLGAGTLTLTLTNFEQNPTGDAQLISGITFDVSGATNKASLTSSSGSTSNINVDSKSNKKFDKTKPDGYYNPMSTSPLAHWAVSGAIGTVDLTTLSGAKPNELIIGPDSKGKLDGSGVYSNANPSISGHDPTVIGSATFVFSILGITSTSKISDVVFQFGTSGTDVTGQPGGSHITSTPEPASIALLGVGLFAIAGYSWRKRQ